MIGVQETPAAAAVEEVTQPGVSGAQGAVEEQRKLQEAAITNLRGKLEELESYAYQVISAQYFGCIIFHNIDHYYCPGWIRVWNSLKNNVYTGLKFWTGSGRFRYLDVLNCKVLRKTHT